MPSLNPPLEGVKIAYSKMLAYLKCLIHKSLGGYK